MAECGRGGRKYAGSGQYAEIIFANQKQLLPVAVSPVIASTVGDAPLLLSPTRHITQAQIPASREGLGRSEVAVARMASLSNVEMTHDVEGVATRR